jgi:hypothetical protein
MKLSKEKRKAIIIDCLQDILIHCHASANAIEDLHLASDVSFAEKHNIHKMIGYIRLIRKEVRILTEKVSK